MFASLETWQRENPIRKRITSRDLINENGNFVTFCGRFKPSRRPERNSDKNENVARKDTFQLVDDRGLVLVKATRFISEEQIEKVIQ